MHYSKRYKFAIHSYSYSCKTMTTVTNRIMRIRVRYEDGVLKPLDKIDAVDGEEFEVIIIRKTFEGFYEETKDMVFEVDRDIVEDFLCER